MARWMCDGGVGSAWSGCAAPVCGTVRVALDAWSPRAGSGRSHTCTGHIRSPFRTGARRRLGGPVGSRTRWTSVRGRPAARGTSPMPRDVGLTWDCTPEEPRPYPPADILSTRSGYRSARDDRRDALHRRAEERGDAEPDEDPDECMCGAGHSPVSTTPTPQSRHACCARPILRSRWCGHCHGRDARRTTAMDHAHGLAAACAARVTTPASTATAR